MKEKNEKKIHEIETRYFAANSQIKTAKEIMREQQENFEIKERFKDASINYPTYGRGLKMPGRELNTFMIQETMCEDKTKKKRSASSGSPKADVQAQQRKRILSPRRMRFENHFEKFIAKKDIDDKLEDPEPPSKEFDTTTKPQGTQNVKVQQKLNYEKEMKIQAELNKKKSLKVLESDAEQTLHDEVTVIMGKDMLNKLKEVFDSCKERDQEHIDEVQTSELIASIAEDEYFEAQMQTSVRITVDEDRETLEELMHRVLKEHKQETIKWHTFLGFFTKRGRLREHEKLNL